MKTFIKWKNLRIVLLTIAVLSNGALIYSFPSWNTDKGYQIAAATSLLNGDGYGYFISDPNDLSRKIFTPLSGWPIGYSGLTAIFGYLLGDIWLGLIALDLLGVLLLYVSWFFILEKLPNLTQRSKTLIWLLLSFFGIPLTTGYSSDLLALSFFSAGLALIQVVASKRGRIKYSIFSGFCFGIAALIRNAYWPLILVSPLSLLIFFGAKSKDAFKSALVCFLFALVLLSSGVAFQKSQTGVSSFLDKRGGEKQEVLYFDKLLRAYPFPILAFNFDEALFRWQGYIAPDSQMKYEPDANFMIKATCWLIALFLLFIYFKVSIHYLFSEKKAEKFFFLFGNLTILITLSMLVFLTVTYPPLTMANKSGWEWVFIESKRYYMVCSIFILTGIIHYIFSRQYEKRKYFKAEYVTMIILLGIVSIQARDFIVALSQKISISTLSKSTIENSSPRAQLFLSAIKKVKKEGKKLVYLESVGDTSLHRSLAASIEIPFSSVRRIKDYRASQRIDAVIGVTTPVSKDTAQQLKVLCKNQRITNLGKLNYDRWVLFHCEIGIEHSTRQLAKFHSF